MYNTILGIDWGTSNRRAYLIDRQGQCLAEYEDGEGLLAVGGRERFSASLDALLDSMHIGADVPVVMSGMVGSASGWQEVPYVDSAVSLDALRDKLVPLADPAWAGRSVRIVPGYCYRNGAETDVMRGEETQLLGAVAMGRRDGLLVLPGTHSKWVLLRDGVIQRLSTYMTGELYAMLSAGGTLSALMKGDSADPAGFAEGLRLAGRREPLSNSLFRVRAGVVAKAAPPEQASALVSGLLIGAEFDAAARHVHAAGAAGVVDAAAASSGVGIALIGSHKLAQRYAAAAAHFGLPCEVLDPRAVYCAAISQFF